MKLIAALATIAALIYLILCLTSCTYSVNLAHTEGSASDLIDEQQTATPDISPTVTIPIKPL